MPHNPYPFTHSDLLRLGNFSSTSRCCLPRQLLLYQRIGISSTGFMGSVPNTHVCVCVHNTCIGCRNQGLKWAATSACTLDSPAQYLPWRLVKSFFRSLFLDSICIPAGDAAQHVFQQIAVQIFAWQRSPFWPKRKWHAKIGKIVGKKKEKLKSESGSENSRYAFIELMDYFCVKTAAHVSPISLFLAAFPRRFWVLPFLFAFSLLFIQNTLAPGRIYLLARFLCKIFPWKFICIFFRLFPAISCCFWFVFETGFICRIRIEIIKWKLTF